MYQNRATLNRVIQGDCAAVLKTLPDASVDFVLTDPPYFVRYRDRSGRTIRNDSDPGQVLDAFNDVYRVLKPNSLCVSFYGWNRVDCFLRRMEGRGLHAGRPHRLQQDLRLRAALPALLARIRLRSRQGPARAARRSAQRRAAVALLRQPQPSDREGRRHDQADHRSFHQGRRCRPGPVRGIGQQPGRRRAPAAAVHRHRA